MKKTLFTIVLGMMAFSLQAQQVVSTFEEINLGADSTLDGSQGDTLFISGLGKFPVKWDTAFKFWSEGWAISNRNDSTKEGFDGMYYSAKGKGNNGSDNYAIGNNLSGVNLHTIGMFWLGGIYITNNAYAYTSMRDGDAFAKKFGGISGNDPDYLLLTIKGWKYGQPINDSVNFYLADFRFADNDSDYIVKDWTWVDLEALNDNFGAAADSLFFQMTSTDNSGIFMNTPGFFCIDDLTIYHEVSVKKYTSSPFKVYPNPSSAEFQIGGVNHVDSWKVFDISGREVSVYAPLANSISLKDQPQGVYFLSIVSGGVTYHHKIIKN